MNTPEISVRTPLGPIWLSSGVTRGNAFTKFYASFISIGMLSGMSLLQGYILAEHLGIPRAEQGRVLGQITLVTEIILIATMPIAGALADRIGRRPMLIASILLIALGYGLYPYATSLEELYRYRIIYALGAAGAASIIATLTNDYPQNRSRGKMIGFSAVMNSLGVAFVGSGLGQIPALLQPHGVDAVTGGKALFLTCSLLCLVSALIFHKGLKGGTIAEPGEQLPFKTLMTSGLRAMQNPRICLSYATAFTGRSDLVIKAIFLSLWAIQDARSFGLNPGTAMARFGIILLLMQIASLIWQPIYGALMDKLNRVTASMISLALAAIGYTSMALITSPLDFKMMPFFIILTLGSSSAIMASIALVGQEAPPKERGAVIGVNGMFGALGILIFSYYGGIWFDEWRPAAPFIVIGLVQAALLLVALVIRLKAPGHIPAKAKTA